MCFVKTRTSAVCHTACSHEAKNFYAPFIYHILALITYNNLFLSAPVQIYPTNKRAKVMAKP